MSQWDTIYERVETDGAVERRHQQREGTAWLDEFLPLLGEPAGESLDLGCGMGSDITRYREFGWNPTSVDLSKKAIEYVQSLGFPAQLSELVERLPFENEPFNLVSGRCSLHFFPSSQAKALFEEIHRILKPGGKLLFSSTANNTATKDCSTTTGEPNGSKNTTGKSPQSAAVTSSTPQIWHEIWWAAEV